MTPGDDPAYYAAVDRAVPVAPRIPGRSGGGWDSPSPYESDFEEEAPAMHQPPPPAAQRSSSNTGEPAACAPRQQQQRQRSTLSAAAAANAAASAPRTPPPDDVDKLLAAREGLMEDILEEEEEIIALHRQQIEESMDVVRKEMAMLAEVDQPGSAIDTYVEALESVLAQKLRSIHALQARVERFKQQLKQEEVMSTTVQRARFSKART